LFLDGGLLSSELRAEIEIAAPPLERIAQSLVQKSIRRAEAAVQSTYYLLGDARYDQERFGKTPISAAAVYDCSATVLQREINKLRKEDKHFDPYGLLWKLWLDEAERVRKQGDAFLIGEIQGIPLRLLVPRDRLHEQAPRYRDIAARMRRFVDRFDQPIANWALQVFGKAKLRPWIASLVWPPEFLKDRVPYVESYFDSHPVFDAGRTKKWRQPIRQFLAAIGRGAKETAVQPLQAHGGTGLDLDRFRSNP